MTLEELLIKYGKHCPKCHSPEVSSNLRYAEDQKTVLGGHTCLDCGHKFDDADAIIGKPDTPKQG